MKFYYDMPIGTVVLSQRRGEEASLLIEKRYERDGVTLRWLNLMDGEQFESRFDRKSTPPLDVYTVLAPEGS